ncbi:mucin-2 [Protobothrops mucrosquamatus]|uniref:mucin-2 n=1 Tax=Protobothrops mucrosquamatus TaxID=103944 RepID=UPI0010FB13FB|nr:mucin-2 [Protobothrops mucrosquamatus]
MGPKVTSLLLLGLVLCYASEIKTVRKSNHGHYVCSTWGNNHFKTFDGDFYQFPGICDYNFASDCRDTYKEFSVHIQREQNDQLHPNIQYVLVAIKDVAIYLTHKRVVVDGQTVKTPYYSSGVLIEKNDIYTKLYAKAGLILIWNQADALMIELDSKFNNLTCGLCGDYNGQQIYNEFISDGLSYNPITFGNLQKINNPPKKCEDPDETKPIELCNQHREECKTLLTSPAFADCQNRLNLELYVQACMHDRCACKHTDDSFCLCSSISEYSRQCSHAGGKPQNWRTHQLCPKSCPKNMIYLESGSPCMDSCSHLEISKLCEEHYMDGCFCPKGTVYDDVTGNGCVLTSQCHCKLHGKIFSPGQKITNECEKCTCQSGRWICQELPCPSTCALEGGSHITTFDGKKYTFHGDCYYVLTKTTKNDTHVLLGELGPCSSSDKQTCLKSVVLLTDQRKNVVVFKSDGTILQNEMEIHLPYRTGSFSVYQPSSFYTIVHTIYGLKLQIQLSPVMQLFLIVEESIKGTIHGLCGDYNGIEGDDFKTSGGVVEATGASFANSWKAQASCSDMEDKLEHPCSLSLENEKYAEFWCSLLKSETSSFARCHSVIDPTDYYKRCKYDTCNCNSNEECLCAALSSYARACAFKGVMLWGWRNVICNKEVNSCPANQVFRYNLTMCQQSCRSLSEGNKYCLEGFTPVDGCGCPDNSYVNEKGICVPMALCSCYYKGLYVQPGDSIMKDDKRCVCKNGGFQCVIVDKRLISFAECSSNKTYFDCTNFESWSSQTPIQLSCQTLGTDHFQTECISGCFCPEGLIDDGQGGCVVEDDCPCIHNQVYYPNGEKINVDCNTCTCQKGNWRCTNIVCHGTCTIYGSGHYITFDGKFYDFVGHCEYVASQDYCGNQQGKFSVITENVLCGTTGVTCTKAIKLFLGTTELKLQEKHIEKIEWTNNSSVTYWIHGTVGLYMVIEASNGMMVIWDKKTTIFIKLLPYHKGKVCGLCGNFDGKAGNDFTTRSMAQDTVSALTFGNSWKKDPACPDVGGVIEPCDVKPHRKTWAEKECSLIKSEVFKKCHHKVDPQPYYEACVHDACSCDTGGDCECFCTAVAAYAHECIKVEACIHWRTPDICPIFCEYYNPSEDSCEWHYEACGREFLTCKILNQGNTNFSVPFLEGCYPRCPPDYPIYDEEIKLCVKKCGCYFNDTYYLPGNLIPNYEPREPCHNCYCQSLENVMCKLEKVCCVYNGKEYEVNETVNKTNECVYLICTLNGTMEIKYDRCTSTISPSTIPTTTSSTTTTITTTMSPTTTTISTTGTSTIVTKIDITKGDNETYENIKLHNVTICEKPENISCRAKKFPEVSLEDLKQEVTCNVSTGFICKNEDQVPGIIPAKVCLDYEISVLCSTPTTTSTTESPTTTITTTPFTPTPTPTPTSTSTTESPTTTTTTPSTPTPTPTPTITSTTESPTTTITTTPSTPTPTPTSTSTTESPTTTITTTSSTPTPTPTPTITSTTESPTTTITTTPSTPTTTSTTESPTTTITTTPSTTTPTPTPTITSTTESPTTTITTTPSTPTPTPTPTITSTTESPTTTTTTPSTPTPTPTITSTTESPTTTITTTPSTPTPTPTPTITSTTESPTTTIITPTPTILPGESGGICNCTELRCITDNKWETYPVKCERPPKPKCANGLAPVEVLDENRCCTHWECDCYCTGWGDPHYMTFDGLYYSYQGNCTYVLMEEINHTIYNFGVYIDNYHCDPAQSVSCTRTLTIKHVSQEVRLKTVKLIPMKVEVTVNHVQVGLPYEKYTLKVYKSGINYVVKLVRLNITVTYNGMAFTIRMPYATFANNTQGQCGKCNNNIQDDCMLRNGTVIPSCEIMADDWVIYDPEKPHCEHMTPPEKLPTPAPCKPSQLCELLKGSTFQECHAVVNFTSYYEACVFDSCRMPNELMECASLQIYAATCADQGVCIDWRGQTKGACPVICRPHKVYKACGPTIEETCKSGLIEQNQTRQMEGCFCPEGTKLYDTAIDVCVEICGCVGPDDIPRKFGENFQFDCKDCTCMEGGSGIICEPYKCPIPVDEVQCEGEGYQKITKINPNDKCCSDTVCECNTTQCTTKPPQCDPGFIAVANNTEEHCCPSYQCNPKKVCVKDGNEYKPGSEVLGGQCEECTCTNRQNSTTLLNIIECKDIPCNVKCQEGYSPVRYPGDCCPKCVQTSCVIRTIENEILILTPGDSQNDPKDNCTLYTCTRIHRQLISSTSVITCPSFDEKRCQPGTLVYLPNGCCKTCILMPGGSSCSATQTMDYINYNGCRSEEQVSVTQCEGRCGTFSLYSPEANSMTHKCSCCRESETSRKEIMLLCPGGIRKKHRYIHVDRCKCLKTECGDEQSSSEEFRDIKQLTTQQPQEEKVMERVKKALRHVGKRS